MPLPTAVKFLNMPNNPYGAMLTVNNRPLMLFRWIMRGRFQMGSPATEKGRETKVPYHHGRETQHQVLLSKGFWLAETVCTQQLWRVIMGGWNPSHWTDNELNPVENVSWMDASAFIDNLNTLSPALQARLPTEAEWEYACRAGTNTIYSFGNTIKVEWANYDSACSYANSIKSVSPMRTIPVGRLSPNPWGLHDMHGNVWEWCQDLFQPDLGATSVDDPLSDKCATPEIRYIIRGGSWYDNAKFCRSATRAGYLHRRREDRLGFRLAADGIPSYT